MTESESRPTGKNERKILENPFIGSLVVPIGIVLIGALIIFGVTKMLSTDRGYRDLVQEMHSKTFGNRWIAAYELSKVIASEQIPREDLPWLVENLGQVYKKSVDPRSRRFIIAALGALKSNLGLPLISLALKEQDKDILFHAVVSIGNMENIENYDWTEFIKILDSKDMGLKQAALLALATHSVKPAESKIESLLVSESISIRYSAATALIPFKNVKALPTLKEILLINGEKNDFFNLHQVAGLKLNILHAVKKVKWTETSSMIGDVAASERDIHVAGVARDVLNQLKN